MKLRDALRLALRSANTWHGALVVMDSYGYDAIPKAYLTDISYTGTRHVIIGIDSQDDWGDAIDIEADKDIDFIIDNFISPLHKEE